MTTQTQATPWTWNQVNGEYRITREAPNNIFMEAIAVVCDEEHANLIIDRCNLHDEMTDFLDLLTRHAHHRAELDGYRVGGPLIAAARVLLIKAQKDQP